MKKLINIGIGCLLTLTATAQQQLSLRECIELGLKQSYQINIVKISNQQESNRATRGYSGQLPKLDIAADANQIHKIGEEENNDVQMIAGGDIKLTFPLFEGFGLRAEYNRLKQIEEEGLLISQFEIEDYVVQLASGYYNILRRQMELQTAQSAIEYSKERLAIAKAHNKVGTLSPLDYKQATIDFNADRSMWLQQKQLLLEAEVELNRLMNSGHLHERFQLLDSITILSGTFKYEDVEQEVLSRNLAIQIAHAGVKVSDYELDKIKSRNYPYLRLNGGYGYQYSKVADRTENNQSMQYGVTLGYNLFNGRKTRIDQKNQRLEIEKKQLEVEDIRLNVNADLTILWSGYQNYVELYQMEKENVIVAKESYDIALKRFELGDISGIELRQSQVSLVEALKRETQSLYSLKIAELSLLQLANQTEKLLM